jgi:hypothetical protein
MSNFSADIIVVGSGPSAVHAAYPLVESGRSVLMLDVGYRDTTYESLIPQQSFTQIRRTDPYQHRYFLGDEFEGISLDPLGAAPQITPPRQYVVRNTQIMTPVVSHSFQAVESFAKGGLGGAWGAVAFPFLDNELVNAGLVPGELRPHYEVVAKRIGISGCQDDLEPLRGVIQPLLPALEIDRNAEMILSRYERRREEFQREGVYMGRPLMATLSQPLGEREAQPYHDMDFWSNRGRSVYNPDTTVNELERHENFSYRDGRLVESFTEEQEGVSVRAKSLARDEQEVFTARRLILAAGALGTGRIVLRSLGKYDVPVPLTCNMHLYIPCLHYRSLGKSPKDRCHSLAQLTIIYDPSGNRDHLVQAQLYSCRSLLLYKLLKESPLPFRESLRAMRSLLASMIVFVIQFEDYQTAGKTCALRRGQNAGQDYLHIEYEPSVESVRRAKEGVKVLRRFMRRLGCLPLRSVEPGYGSSVHYASLLPISGEEKPLTTEPSGRLRGTRQVYIADGAALAYLPAKGLTLTLMANANRVGQNVVNDLAG